VPLVEVDPRKVTEWMNSEEGKRALQKALEDGKRSSQLLHKAMAVSPDSLNKPYGPANGQRFWSHQG